MKVINESIIRKIVSESLTQLLSELSIGQTGVAGPINGSDMIVPSQEFAKEYAVGKEICEKKLKDPQYKVNLNKIFGNTLAYKVYNNYYSAMMSRPHKKAVKFLEWLQFVCEGKHGHPIMAFKVGESYLFGLWIDGFFLSAYFAPAGKMGMWSLIRDISKYSNIIFAVTQDLSPMLKRLGMPQAETQHKAPWRGKTVTKDVFGTSQEAIEKGIEILDYGVKIDKAKRINSNNLDTDTISKFEKQFAAMSPEKKEMLKKKFGPMLKMLNADAIKKIGAENGIGI